jgi:hypothetical protein
VPLVHGTFLGRGLLADGLGVLLGDPPDVGGLLLGQAEHVRDALAHVLEGGGGGRGGLAAQRLDLAVHRGQLAGQVRRAAHGGVAVGDGDAEVGLEALDRLRDLVLVVAAQHHVERVLSLVHRHHVAVRVAHAAHSFRLRSDTGRVGVGGGASQPTPGRRRHCRLRRPGSG